MRTVTVLITLMLLPAGASAARGQDVKIPPNVEKLAAKAVETVNVTVDGALLQLAGKFLSSTDPDQKKIKALIDNLKGIYVRSFEFANEGEYSEADVESLRSQLRGSEWSRIVNVTSKKGGDNVDVAYKMDKGKIAGLVVIAAEPKELTIVNIVGPIDLDQLSSLGGQFGIPKVDLKAPEKGPEK
jgi:Domain of unknown function (DUF4252)